MTARAKILRACLKAGRDPGQTASILMEEADPEVMNHFLERILEDITEAVLRDMPHLADDPEAAATEVVRRLESEAANASPEDRIYIRPR